MKNLSDYLTERLFIFPSQVDEKLVINKNFKDNKIVVSSLKELKSIIKDRSIDPSTKKFNKDIDLSDIDVSKLDDLSETFLWYKFETINISGWDTSKVKNMRQMFFGCEQLTDIIGIEDMNIDNCEDMSYMFADCTKLDISDKIKDWKVDPSSVWVTNIFRDCPTKFMFTMKK